MTGSSSKSGKPDELAKVTVLKGDGKATVAAPHERSEAHNRQVHLVVMAGSSIGQVFTLIHGMNVIGRDDAAQVKIDDAGISRRHAMIFYDAPSDSFLIRDMESRNGTSVNSVDVREPRTLQRGDKIEVGIKTVLRLSYGDEIDTRFAKQMLHETLHDGLTGIYNRRKLNQSLETAVPAARKAGANLSMLLLDIDHFKRVNDTYGHPAGDAVLRWLCGRISATLQPGDLLARYGGEEFAVLCPKLSEEQAAELGEKIRLAVARHPCIAQGAAGTDPMTTQEIDPSPSSLSTINIPVTISLGVAELALADTHGASLVDAADQALYAAKRSGRNRVVRFSRLQG